ncbi:hypothetical protein [Microbacterium caowuchunii]|uniref:hypothetical protein n=1 Tax=Microbacterium caowuchunii TaxID=2614638 RepID=UPI0017857753|nr:hypothetical protein [Microbacterium caowuchunii]
MTEPALRQRDAERTRAELLLDRDLLDPARRDHLRRMIGDIVVAWLTDADRTDPA